MTKLNMLLLSALICSTVLLSGQDDDFGLIFPDDTKVVHFRAWPGGLPPRTAAIQEWRRDLATQRLVKGDTYRFDRLGRLTKIEFYDEIYPETWTYSYGPYDQPEEITVEDANGYQRTYRYSYFPNYSLIAIYDDTGLKGRRYWFYDDDNRLRERKDYWREDVSEPLALDLRIIYTYVGDSDDCTGEMHYDYFNDSGQVKVLQSKRLHQYNWNAGGLVRTLGYKPELVRPDNWARTQDMTEVTEEIRYTYDPISGHLIKKTLNADIYDQIDQQWTWEYRNGHLRYETWEEYDFDGDVFAREHWRYEEHGGAAGFEYLYDSFSTKAYRSSFVIQQ